MASVRELARAHQRQQARIASSVSKEATRLWKRVDRADIAGSWLLASPRLLALLTAAQIAAARPGDEYAAAILAAQGFDLPPAGQVVPEAFGGTTSTGGSLTAALAEPVIAAKVGLASGWGIDRAMGYGLAVLTRTVDTQVADAGRGSVSVATATRKRVKWYVRMVSPGACSRCIILAGRRYAWNEGFLRHPHCHCRHIPVAEDADDFRTDPKAYFHQLSPAEQDRVFGKAGAQAIRDGADLSQVVNARRGMNTTAIFGREITTTTTGTTRRGLAGRRLIAKSGARREEAGFADRLTKTGRQQRLTHQQRAVAPRLMPEQIYADAKRYGLSRDQVLGLLRTNGFIL